jgi:hypothetical protein
MALRVTRLFIHPIKSAGGIAVDEAFVGDRGFVHDRRFMVVDSKGVALTQRERPRMALLRVALDGDDLRVRAPGAGELSVPLRPREGAPREVAVWGDRCRASSMGEEASRFLTAALGLPCELVYMPDASRRPVDPAYAADAIVGFADGFPFLLVSEESLVDLNGRLAEPVPMNRFRPNLVVSGGEPFAEDGWRAVRVGGIRFDVVKPCARCVMPSIDQTTGEKGVEPARTLAAYRAVGQKVLFGQNLVHHGRGPVRVGDPVEVL